MPLVLPAFLLDIPRTSVVAVGIPLTLGILSGSSTAQVVRSPWYTSLLNPPGRPPRQVFPIVWPLLYLSMGWASHIASKMLASETNALAKHQLQLGLTLYYVQLCLNIAWSPLFFMGKQLGLALVDSIMLTTATYCMTVLFHGPTNGKTTAFLIPYCAWLTFATYLNGGIWWLNKGNKDHTS